MSSDGKQADSPQNSNNLKDPIVYACGGLIVSEARVGDVEQARKLRIIVYIHTYVV